ncbi:MAG: NnrU family protein [Paludibacterium sp.]|uniref:NnrU family protein n=1 Tax=Paludibacterium sp. TaxID=1917523 RepID=UPI0025E61BEC|nr:NnrU family protein [Paludibacterium sp.]MBV8047491.1 NnrU family protein [Paludibacterium sp.]MBV8646372.1 NnrU family protein [Paludibacterium sp.]
MMLMLLGLLIFLAMHSVRLWAPAWREAQIARLGQMVWRGIHSVAALVGLALIVKGYAAARLLPGVYWQLPFGARHGMMLVMLFSFILLIASQIPGNHIKQRVGHPMSIGLVLWSGMHLIFNGRPADLVLFGAFFVWSLSLTVVSLRRDRAAGVAYPPGHLSRDLLVCALAVVLWLGFILSWHLRLIGVGIL